ncbi:MAG: hypothetical protein RLZZ450_5182 [Pseudomonadota bacterium]|jgi:hypothetical protein
MSTPRPITPEAVAKHVHALLATNVTVKKLPSQELKGPLVFGSVHDEAGVLVCAVVADISAAGSTGGALSKIPAGAVQDLVRKGQILDEDLLGNYHEVVNVLTVLTTAALGRRTILREVDQTKTVLEGACAELVKTANAKLFLQVAVQGYPAGGINLYLGK